MPITFKVSQLQKFRDHQIKEVNFVKGMDCLFNVIYKRLKAVAESGQKYFIHLQLVLPSILKDILSLTTNMYKPFHYVCLRIAILPS